MATGRNREIRKLDRISNQSAGPSVVRRRNGTVTPVKGKAKPKVELAPKVEIRKLKVEIQARKVASATQELIDWSRSYFQQLDRMEKGSTIKTADID